ncbi:family 43 glycosylhydrolase [Aureibacillus halotolerans]|uniref:Glycosyl hydrolase family 43 n=1 Tax=Aureibacillus halotolerans TaxID=1508390 RepID=A0A4R6U2Y3_9BACI|nr:family 43 glycosylhydrolase [Aureibacillus halotolerans]TDQ40361.1 glycosyl hydrolase family 43 [Aureibacillus halotolerans]
MKFADTSRGRPFTKDPAVVSFKGKYWMYYTLGPYVGEQKTSDRGFSIGIAVSDDLEHWETVGEIPEDQTYEQRGICAPGAIVLDNRIHVFYQTYGNGANDAICHAVSDDGTNFTKNSTNPVFRPTGPWNNGRAIDADVIVFKGKLWLYFATRDPQGDIQMQGVASASLDSDFVRSDWIQECDEAILYPELPWEQECIEAAAVCEREGKLYMFYAGAYNNKPQQIGCAVSVDAVQWTRLFQEPFLSNGKPGSWNESESGHPFVFTDENSQTHLFFQGNNDMGRTWYISRVSIGWRDGTPYVDGTGERS